MKRLYKGESFDKVVLVSGDGDYKMLVDFLLKKNDLKKYFFQIKRGHHLYINQLRECILMT